MWYILPLLTACTTTAPPSADNPGTVWLDDTAGPDDTAGSGDPPPLIDPRVALLVGNGADGIVYGADPADLSRLEELVRVPGMGALRHEADGVWLLGAAEVRRYRVGDWSAHELEWAHSLGCTPLVSACGQLLWMGCTDGDQLAAVAPDSGDVALHIDLAALGSPGAPDRLLDLACVGDTLWLGMNPSVGEYQDPGRLVAVDAATGALTAELGADRNPRLAPDPTNPGRLWVTTEVPDGPARVWAVQVASPALTEPVLELPSSYEPHSVLVRPSGELVVLARIYGGRGMHWATQWFTFDPVSKALTVLGYLQQESPAGIAMDAEERAWMLLDGDPGVGGFVRLVAWDLRFGEAGELADLPVTGEDTRPGQDSVMCW